jgi:2'-5' RNA ligase
MSRCFLGFELTDASRAYLRERLLPLQRTLAEEHGWPLRLVPPENWHATLLFFPRLAPPDRAPVWQAVEAAVAAGAWRRLDFAWRGLRLWPSPRRPALLCVEGERYEAAAQWPLTARLAEPPFSLADTQHLRSYIPHLTVMRFRKGHGVRLPKPRDWEAVQPLLPAIDGAALRFDRVSFFLSTVSPEQPIYPRERTLPLEG